MATGCRGRVVLGLILALWHPATGAASPQTPLCEDASECSEGDATGLLHLGKAVKAALGPRQSTVTATATPFTCPDTSIPPNPPNECCEYIPGSDEPANTCRFDTLALFDGPTSVYLPAGDVEYKCFLGDLDDSAASRYNFGVIPGEDRTKLLIYFSPGGACFQSGGVGSLRPVPAPGAGFELSCQPYPDNNRDVVDNVGFILSDDVKNNPFWDFTKVHLKYCSGDLFLGNSVQTWTNFPDIGIPLPTVTVQHRGYNQARAVLDWVKDNFPWVKKLAVAGSSAGSLGAQYWTSTIFKEMKFDEGYTVYDSYVGIFPPGTESSLVKQWYAGCGLPLLSRMQKNACEANLLKTEDFLLEALRSRSLKEVFFSHVQTKYDETQREFYGLVNFFLFGEPSQPPPATLGEGAFYYQINEVLKRYATAGGSRYAVRMLESLFNDGKGELDDHAFATTDMWFDTGIANFVRGVLDGSATSVCVGDDLCQRNVCGLDCKTNSAASCGTCDENFCDKDLFCC